MMVSAHGHPKRKYGKNEFSFVTLLKICAKKKDLREGSRLHSEIVKQGLLEKIPHIASSLINMYAKCGMIAKAQELHDELHVQNIVSWNALIAGYVQVGQGHEAWTCFEQMRNEGFSPNEISYVCALKACSSIGAIGRCKQIHDEVVQRGLPQTNIILGNALIDMYAKCGMLVEAREVHNDLSLRDVVSWSTLIAGYVQQGQGHEALNCFTQMQAERLSPNAVTFTCIVKACANTEAIDKGTEIHSEIVQSDSLKCDIILATALVEMYVKFNMLAKAEQVLDELPVGDAMIWNVLIAGYIEQGQSQEALDCFQRMQEEGLSPNIVSYIYILKACGSIVSIKKGEQIHDEIVNRGLPEKENALGTALVDMYAKCGMLEKAKKLHDELLVQSVVSWNALITGYALQGQGSNALNCLEQMQSEGFSPDEVTFICILKVCGDTGAIEKGKHIHDEVVRRGLLKNNNLVLGTALVDMYAKCGFLAKAQQVHCELEVRNAVIWNALMFGYIQQCQSDEALACFERIQSEGLCPNEITFTFTLRACGCTKATSKGKQIHCIIIEGQMLEKSVVLGNALIDMYAKCNGLTEARQVLEELPFRDVVSWSSLIAGYAQQEQGHEALNCLRRMQADTIAPNAVTFICALNACASIGAMGKGKQIHQNILSIGFLEKVIALGNALVDMYAKCGALAKAQQVLFELNMRNVVTWNALITGYAQQGQGHEALNCVKCMQCEGISLNEVTFLCILNACSHSGLLYEAQMHFIDMAQKYSLQPNIEHYTCMVVVFGHAGLFEKAVSVIKTISSGEYPSVWLALLGACRKWGNVKLGKLAFDEVLLLDNGCAAAYTLMANIYAAAGMQADAEKVGTMRLKSAAL